MKKTSVSNYIANLIVESNRRFGNIKENNQLFDRQKLRCSLRYTRPETDIQFDGFEYYPVEDSLYAQGILIYSSGNWASLIGDEQQEQLVTNEVKKKNPEEIADIIEKTIKEISKAENFSDQLITEVCKKYDVSENHIRKVGGWNKEIKTVIIPVSENKKDESATAKSQEEINVSFIEQKDKKEILRLCVNGDILLDGNLIKNDKSVVDLLTKFTSLYKIIYNKEQENEGAGCTEEKNIPA